MLGKLFYVYITKSAHVLYKNENLPTWTNVADVFTQAPFYFLPYHRNIKLLNISSTLQNIRI